MDAANIDLKGFTEAFYRELCSGELTPVLETLKDAEAGESPPGDYQSRDPHKE